MRPDRTTLLAGLDRVFRLALGGIFIYAASSKIQDPALFAKAVASYQMLPDAVIGLIALVLPMTELIAGTALIATRWTRESALLLLGMMGVFLIGLTQAAIRGLDISCGCFGGADAGEAESIGAAIVRDLFLLVPTVWLAVRPNAWFWNRAFSGVFLAGLAAAGVYFARPPAAPAAAPPAAGHRTAAIRVVDTNAVATAQAILAASARPTGRTAVREKWTTDFPTALAQARADNRPLLMLEGSHKCPHCKRLRKALGGRAFAKWIGGTGFYLAEAYTDETNKAPAQAQLVQFLQGMPGIEKLQAFPFVGIYWEKPPTNVLQTVFCGRRGEMPGKRHPSLACEFATAVERLLGDYLKTCPPRPTTDEMVAASLKRIAVARKGMGKVVMQPLSGELRDNGGYVLLTAKPAKGCTMAGWQGPNGKFLKKDMFAPTVLRVTYGMAEGTYTAVFKKKR